MNFSRRDFFEKTGATALVGIASAALPGFFFETANAATSCGPFAIPPGPTRMRFRYWWPGGYIEPSIVAKEVKAMADAGFGGFEIADVRDEINVAMDPKVYGWGTDRWVAGVEAALETAIKYNLGADITIGPHWPAGIPGVKPDDDAAAKELTHQTVTVEGGKSFSGELPGSAATTKSVGGRGGGGAASNSEQATITPKLVAALAYMEASKSGSTVTLDFGSMVNLTSRVTNNKLDWTAPAGGTWRLLFFYCRGTAQTAGSSGPSPLAYPIPYAVDVYGLAGTQAIIDYWEKKLITPKGRELMKKVKGNIFEDSLELQAEKNWSPDYPNKFKALHGYDMIPYLPLLAVASSGGRGGGGAIAGFGGNLRGAPYALTGVDTERFNNDYERTLSSMYIKDHIQAMMKWTETFNWGFRVQCSDEAAAYVSVPEGDNGDDIDGFAALAAGRDLGGRKILSDEAATFVGGSSHVADWRVMMFMIQRDYIGGVNQVVLHGFSYADGPNEPWPGFSAFGRHIGADWGPRSPDWELAADVSGYISRMQRVLQTGRSQSDIMVLGGAKGPGGPGSGPVVSPLAPLRYAGYTYQALAPELLEHPNAVVSNKRLAPNGPAYKAMVFQQTEALDAAIAERVLSYAKAGLPIVMVGELPDRAPGLAEQDKRDARVKAAMTALVALKNVSRVANIEEAPKALKAAGIIPSLGFSKKSRVLGLKRVEGKTDYFYFLNDTDAPNQVTLSLAGTGKPFRLNLWTGAIEPIAVYTAKNGRIDIPTKFTGNDAVIIAISEDPAFCSAVPAVNAESAEGELRVADGVLTVRATKAGKYTAKLSNGKTATAEVGAVAAERELSSWSLAVEDWQEGATATEIKKTNHNLKLSKLASWTEIEELKTVSGVGRYTTTVKMDANWSKDQGAILDFGKVRGTLRLYVNGKQTPPVNQFTMQTDIGPYLQAGDNQIEVVVATTLNNRLFAIGDKKRMDGRGGQQGGGMPGGQQGGGAAGGRQGGGQQVAGMPGDQQGGGMPGGGPGAQTQAAAPLDPDPAMRPPTGVYLGALEDPGRGMNPGAGQPSQPRKLREYGLIGPVKLIPYRTAKLR